jgi:excisionase family DNA binding protein
VLSRIDKPEIMLLEEVAAWLRCSTITVYRMAQLGQIPCRRVGRLYRFRSDELNRWQVIRDAQSNAAVTSRRALARSAAVKGGQPAAKS